MSADRVLQVTGLQTHLGPPDRPVRAVNGVDLTILRGETFALLGESGCGKSICALSVMRLLPTSARIPGGSIRLGDRELLDLSEREMRSVRGGRIGMIFQEPMTSLNPVLTVGEQIAEVVRAHDPQASGAVEQRVLELLKAVNIPAPGQRIGEYPHQLSGGMKQRVMIACALAGRPELLIADEPTTALDVTIQAEILRLLKTLQRETGMAILLITHDLGVVAESADRIAVMYAGEIVETAPVKAFFRDPRHPYGRKLFRSLPGGTHRGAPLDVIEGMVPALDGDLPPCRFAERCPLVEERCRTQPPPWVLCDHEHQARCHRSDVALPARPSTATAPDRPATPDTPLLRTTDLEVHFPIRTGLFKRVTGQVRAVDGVDIEIPEGHTLGLVGESGCGKTTAGLGILQLIPPTAGRVWFRGNDLSRLKGREMRALRAEIQVIFQDPFSSMNPRMTVGDIVAEGILAQGMERSLSACRNRVLDLLRQVGIRADAVNRYPHEFSGGQRQRICIARALAVEPKLIICDEPTSALDVSVQAQILNLLVELQQQLGLSYLFITHNIAAVSHMAHEIAVMYLGRIVEQGTTDAVLKSPQHPYTRALLSAVLRPDPREKGGGIPLSGDLPSPANPPAGCHFQPRCPSVMERCRHTYPPVRQHPDGRTLRCFLEDKPPPPTPPPSVC